MSGLTAISRTLKNAGWLALGAGFGPLVQLIATHWLARIYSPTDYGHLALFMSMAGIVVTVSCLRYEATIAAVDEERTTSAVWVSLGSAMLVCLTLVATLAFGMPQNYLPQFQSLGMGIWGVPIYGLSGGVLIVALQLTLRRAQFRLNAVFRSFQTVLFVIAALTLTHLGLVNASLLSGTAISLLALAYLIKSTTKVRPSDLLSTAREYVSHPLLLMPSALLDAVAISAPILFISKAFGPSDTGHYFQVQKIVGAPLLMMAVVVGQLFLKRSGEIFRSGNSAAELLWKVIWVQGLVGVTAIAFLITFGELLFDILLGRAWHVDVVFLMLATMPLLFRVIVSPVSSIFITHRKVALGVRWQVGYFLSTLSVLYIASNNLNFEQFLLVYAIHEFAVYSIYLYLANKVARETREA